MGLLTRSVGLVILLAAVLAAGASFFYNQNQETQQATRLAMQVDVRLQNQLAVLEGARALYQSSEPASGPAIRAFLTDLNPQKRAPGMQGVGIAIAIQQATPAAAEERLLQNYGRAIAVWPTSDQPIGFPIVLLEPGDVRNTRALGYDMYSEPVRREAMRRAWTSGQPSASGIVNLVQEGTTRQQPGFLIYVPLYAHTENASPPAARDNQRPIEGFAFAPFRTHDLMEAVIGLQLASIKGVEIRAGTAPDARVVYRHGTMHWGAHDQVIHIADQAWLMRISFGRFTARLGRPLGIFIFGVALALIAAQLHSVQRRRIDDLHALAEERARHAEDRELMIGEMAHRMKNAFARIGALARITLREAESLDDFETRFDGRLRALSNAKQLIVTGAVETVELGAIIRKELRLAGWPDARIDALTGPKISLDDETAQALALAIHELATNSVKYGALSGQGALDVEWKRRRGRVELRWVESDLDSTPVFDQESFGSQFIRSLIERQLKGEWARSAGDHSLTIEINWPLNDPSKQ